MILLTFRDALVFVELDVTYRGQTLHLSDILLDTGSSGTLISVQAVESIGLEGELTDTIRKIFGVGGVEYVIEKTVDSVTLAGVTITNFAIELGELNYGFVINGIVGLDLLRAVHATIDLDALALHAR